MNGLDWMPLIVGGRVHAGLPQGGWSETLEETAMVDAGSRLGTAFTGDAHSPQLLRMRERE
jgi:hypothetical protein